jgi:N1221-like protein
LDPTPYEFAYGDAASFPEELDEWFSYTIEERGRISVTQFAYGQQQTEWRKSAGDDLSSWIHASEDQRRKFMKYLKDGIAERSLEVQRTTEAGTRDDSVSDVAVQKLEALTYLVLGAFSETAGLGNQQTHTGANRTEESVNSAKEASALDPYHSTGLQLEWIRKNTLLFLEDGGAKIVLDIFRASADREFLFETMQLDNNSLQRQLQLREVWSAQTLLYTCLEVIRSSNDAALSLSHRAIFCKCCPVQATGKRRLGTLFAKGNVSVPANMSVLGLLRSLIVCCYNVRC